jgi:hypothetical protein
MFLLWVVSPVSIFSRKKTENNLKRDFFCILDEDDSDEYTTEEEETDHGDISE